jgi:hypothetical protein
MLANPLLQILHGKVMLVLHMIADKDGSCTGRSMPPSETQVGAYGSSRGHHENFLLEPRRTCIGIKILRNALSAVSRDSIAKDWQDNYLQLLSTFRQTSDYAYLLPDNDHPRYTLYPQPTSH